MRLRPTRPESVGEAVGPGRASGLQQQGRAAISTGGENDDAAAGDEGRIAAAVLDAGDMIAFGDEAGNLAFGKQLGALVCERGIEANRTRGTFTCGRTEPPDTFGATRIVGDPYVEAIRVQAGVREVAHEELVLLACARRLRQIDGLAQRIAGTRTL